MSGGIKSGLERKVGERGKGRRTKLRTTATTVVGEAWPLGLDMMGGFSFFFFFSSDWIGLRSDWIGLEWPVGGGRSGSDWRFTTAICSSSS